MKYHEKYLWLYLGAIISFASSVALLAYVMMWNDFELEIFLAITVLLILAALCYCVSTKHITCEGGYNWIQAFLAYKKCVKHGAVKLPKNLKPRDKNLICDIVQSYDFGKEFNEKQALAVFEVGYEIVKMLKS